MHRTDRKSRSILAATIALTMLGSTTTRAGTDGTWVGVINGDLNWSNPNNWANASIADGSDGNATFASDQIGVREVTVDSPRTIGNLSFSGPDPLNTDGTLWHVFGTGPLTLQTSSGTPTITVNSLNAGESVDFSIPLAGTQGILLAGSGTVVSSGINTFIGGLTIPAGLTFIGSGDFLAGQTNTLTVNGTFLLKTASTVNKVVANLTGSGTIGAEASAPTGGLGFRIKQGSFSGNITDGPGGAGGSHLALVFDSSASGIIELSGVNTYTGDTLVRNGGILRLSSTTALPDLSYLRLETGSGVLAAVELNAGGDFSRKLGGATTSNSGGINLGGGSDAFGTLGIDRKVTFTDGTNPVPLKWTTGGFNPNSFVLGTVNSTNKTTLTNSIDLNGGSRIVASGNGSADIDGEFAGQFSNSSATAATLTLNGPGTLLLSADNSPFTGKITINTGIVRLSSPNSLGSPTTGTVTLAGGSGGTGRLELTDGLSIAKPLILQGRQLASSLSPAISGISGNTTVSGTVTCNAGGNLYNLSAEAGSLTITGTITNAESGDRFLQLMGAAGQGLITSNVTNGLGRFDLEKFGNSTWTLSGPANTYSGTTNVHAGTLVLASSQTTTSSVTLDSGATLKVSPGGDKTIKTSAINLTGTAVFDLADNKLALTNVTPDALRSMLLVARATGDWSGPGLASSAAAAEPNHLTAIGYALASDLGVSTWGSAAVNPGHTVARYTWYGDLNLDGKVNADDFALLDRGFAKQLTGWINGDVNYDNTIDSNDYLLVDRSFAFLTGALSPALLAERQSQFGAAYVNALIAAVPEPASLLISAFALTPALTRRRR